MNWVAFMWHLCLLFVIHYYYYSIVVCPAAADDSEFTSSGRTDGSSTPLVFHCGHSVLSGAERAAPTAPARGPCALAAGPCVQPASGTGWPDGLAGSVRP